MSADFSLGDLTSGEPPEYDPANPEAWYEYYKDVLDTAYQPDYPELRDAGQEPDAKGDAEIVKRAGILPPSMLKPSPADDHLIGQTIEGRYRIISRLDAGGMGTAYRSWDERVGVPVVIKIPNRRF